MIGILISPAEGSSGFVVLADVTDQLCGKVADGSENSARDDISLNFGKPDLHLIEPTRIGRSVVEAKRGIFLEELENLLGFMRAQVVDDEVNFSTLGLAGHDLAQKINKLDTGMSGGGLSHDVAGAGIERRIQ